MIFPDVSVVEWIKKYPSLSEVTTSCFDCGREIVANKPFITKHYVGLVSSKCICGSNCTGCECKTTSTIEEHNKWSMIMDC